MLSGRVLSRHAKDQRPDLLVYRLAASESPNSGEPLPIQAKAGAMPLDKQKHESNLRQIRLERISENRKLGRMKAKLQDQILEQNQLQLMRAK